MNPNDYYDSIMEEFLRQAGNWSTWTSQDFGTSADKFFNDDKKLLKAIKEDTTEYFRGAMGKDLSYALTRRTLTKDERDRVVGFMKERLKWYNENGFLL